MVEQGRRARAEPADNAAAAELIGAGLIVMAGITLALKIAYIAQLVILAIEVAQAIATAFVTFGATTAEIPGFIAATRAICREALNKVISMVEREIAQLFAAGRQAVREGRGEGPRQGRGASTPTSSATAGTCSTTCSARPTGSTSAARWTARTSTPARTRPVGACAATRRTRRRRPASTSSRPPRAARLRRHAPLRRHPRHEQADKIWKRLSSRYGESASGDTEVLLHQGNPERPLSGKIFMQDEITSLRDNPNINSVTVRDPTTGYMRTFTRQELVDLGDDLSSVLPPGAR